MIRRLLPHPLLALALLVGSLRLVHLAAPDSLPALRTSSTSPTSVGEAAGKFHTPTRPASTTKAWSGEADKPSRIVAPSGNSLTDDSAARRARTSSGSPSNGA